MSQFNSSFTINNSPNQQFYAKNYTSDYLKFNTNKKKFRMGGMITKIDPLKRYIMLSNGHTQAWSVQIPNTIFYKKLTDEERKEEIKKELLTEINNDETIEDLKKKMKILINKVSTISNENVSLKKKNDKLTKQLNKIKIEIENK